MLCTAFRKITEQQKPKHIPSCCGLPVLTLCIASLNFSCPSLPLPCSPETETDLGALWYRISSVRVWAHHQGDHREHCLWRLLQVSQTCFHSRSHALHTCTHAHTPAVSQNFPTWTNKQSAWKHMRCYSDRRKTWLPSCVRMYFYLPKRNITWFW